MNIGRYDESNSTESVSSAADDEPSVRSLDLHRGELREIVTMFVSINIDAILKVIQLIDVKLFFQRVSMKLLPFFLFF